MAIPHERPEPPKKKKTKKPPQAERPPTRGDLNPTKKGRQPQPGAARPTPPRRPSAAPERPTPKRRPSAAPERPKKPPPRRQKKAKRPGPQAEAPAAKTPPAASGRVPRAPRDNQTGGGVDVGGTPPLHKDRTAVRSDNYKTISIQRAIKANGDRIKVDGKHGGRSQRALEIRARAMGQGQRNIHQEAIEAQRISGRPTPSYESVFSPTFRVFGESTGEVTRVAPKKQDPVLHPPEGRPYHGSDAQKAIDRARIMRARVRQGQRRTQSARYLRTMAHAHHVWLAKTRFNSEENAKRARPADVRAFFFDPEFGRWGHLRVPPAFVAADVRGVNLMRAYLREQGHKKTVARHGRWDDALQDAVKAEAREWRRVERRQAVRRIEKAFFETGAIMDPDKRGPQLVYLPFAEGYIDLDEITPRQLHDILEDRSPLSEVLFKELIGRLGKQRDQWALGVVASQLGHRQRAYSYGRGHIITVQAEEARLKAEQEEPWWQFSLDAFNATSSAFSHVTESFERGFHTAASLISIGGLATPRVVKGSSSREGGLGDTLKGYYARSDAWFDEFDEKHPWWGLVIDFVADPLNIIPPLWFVKPIGWTGRGLRITAKAGEKTSIAARHSVADARFLPDRLDALARLPAVPYHAGVWSAEKAEQFWNVAAPWLREAPGIRHGYRFAAAAGKLKDHALEVSREAGQLAMIDQVIKKGKALGMDQARHKHAKRLKMTIGELARYEREIDEGFAALMPGAEFPALHGLNDDFIQWFRKNEAAMYAEEGGWIYSKAGGVAAAKFAAEIAGKEVSDLMYEQAWGTTFELIARTEEANDWARRTRKAAEADYKGSRRKRPDLAGPVRTQRFYATEMRKEVARLKKKHGGTIPANAQKEMMRNFRELAGLHSEKVLKDFFAKHGDSPSKAEWERLADEFTVDLDDPYYAANQMQAVEGGLKAGTPEAKEFAEREFVRLLLRSPVYKSGMQDPRLAAIIDEKVEPMLEALHQLFMPRLHRMVVGSLPREKVWDEAGKALVNREEWVTEFAEEVRQMFNRKPLKVPNINFNRKFTYAAANDLYLGEMIPVTRRLEYQRRIDQASGKPRSDAEWNEITQEAQLAVKANFIDVLGMSKADGVAILKEYGITWQGRGVYDRRKLLTVEPEQARHLMAHKSRIRKFAHDPAFREEYGDEYVEQLLSAFDNFESMQKTQHIVRGADGRPQEFLHATGKLFDKFSDESLMTGFGGSVAAGHYFAPAHDIPKAIKAYEQHTVDLVKKAKKEGTFFAPLGWAPPRPNVKRVNLLLENPLNAMRHLTPQWLDEFEQAALHAGVTDFSSRSWNPFQVQAEQFRVHLASGDPWYTIDEGRGLPVDPGTGYAERDVEIHDFLRSIRGADDSERGSVKRDLTRVLQEMGHDGVMSWDEAGFAGARDLREVVVFSADQIVEPQPFSALEGTMPPVERAAAVFREMFNTTVPLVPRPWAPDMQTFYRGFGTSEENFRTALTNHRDELEMIRRGAQMDSLKGQGAYWQALRHAQGKPYRILYYGLAGAMGTWRFATLPLNPGWLVRNTADNWAKLMLSGVINPKAWWYEGLDGIIRSIFDVDVARLRDAMRFIDRVHGNMPRALNPQYRQARTFEERFMARHADEQGIDDTLWNEGRAHGYSEEEMLSMMAPGGEVIALTPADLTFGPRFYGNQHLVKIRRGQDGTYVVVDDGVAIGRRTSMKDAQALAESRWEAHFGRGSSVELDLGLPEQTWASRYGLGGPANPTLRNENAASDWFEHVLESGFWSAPIKQIESVFKHYDIQLHPKVLEQASMAHEGDRLLPRFHGVNKGRVVPGRAPSKTTWGSEEQIVDKWRHHWGGVSTKALMKEKAARFTTPSGHVVSLRTGEIQPMSPWEQMRVGVDPNTGQKIGAWIARFHDNVWELFGNRPENMFKRIQYRDAYQKAMLKHGDSYRASEEAWAAVERTLFDYSKITVIEDNFRIFFPFIQFWRKNTGFWLRTFAQKPWFLQDLAMYQDTLERVHENQPPWMRRYISLKEVADIVARVPALEWMAEHLENARIDPLNLLSFAPLYRAFKSTNPNLPPEEAGLGFLGGFIDALNEWGLSMNPLFRKPLEWFGVLDFRSWQNILPQTSIIEGFTRRQLGQFFPDGINIEDWLSDPILNLLGKDTMQERSDKKFNDYVQLEMAGQAQRGEEVSRERAEEKIRGFLWAQTLVGFFSATYMRRMTPEDVHFSKLAYGMSQGTINYFDFTNEEKLVYQLYKQRNFDTVVYDKYVEALPLLRSYYNKSYDDAQAMLQAHPELIPFVTKLFGRGGITRENWTQEIMLQQKSNRTMDLFALLEQTDIPYETRRMASQLLVTPELQAYWDRPSRATGERRRWEQREMQWKMIRAQYQRRIDDMHRNFHAIPDWDWEAKQGYRDQHPELVRYWQMHGSASDDYRTIAFGVEKTLRDRYFEILDTKTASGDPSWDEAIDFLQQFPFIFDSTDKRKKYREVARVGHFPGYVPGGYARGGGGTWRDFGISEHARDYLHARPFLDRFFDMLERQGKQVAYDWLDGNSKGAKIVQAYFNEYSKGGKVGSTPKARAYLKAKKALDHFFGLPKGQRDKWLWGRSPQAKLVREYFRKYAKGGLKHFEDKPMSQHHKDYLEAKEALRLYFGMSEAERVKWLNGSSAEAALVKEYFEKYADERGQTQHAKDYLAIKDVLEQYFALPKGAERKAFINAHPELEDYFAKYSDTDKTEKAFTVDGRGGQYLPAHWSYGHSYRGRGASGRYRQSSFNRFFESKDPQLRKRLEFWRIYFSLTPAERPQFVLDHADEYGVFIYGVLGPQDEADKQSEMMAKAFAFARNGDRSMLYGLLQPLIDFFFSLTDPAERQLMLRANPELEQYFALTADEISTGDPVLDKLLEQYYKLPRGSRMRTIMLDQNPALKAFIEENSTQEDDAIHSLLEVYFTLSAADKKQYRIDHPELQEYFDKRSEEKENEKTQLEAFDRADPRLKKYFDAAEDEIEYSAWLRLQQMQHERLRPIAIAQRRERRQEVQQPVMAY